MPVVIEVREGLLEQREALGKEEEVEHKGDLRGPTCTEVRARKALGLRAHGHAKEERDGDGALDGDRCHATNPHAHREGRRHVERHGEAGVLVVEVPAAKVKDGVDQRLVFVLLCGVGSCRKAKYEARVQRKGDEHRYGTGEEVLAYGEVQRRKYLSCHLALKDSLARVPLGEREEPEVDLDREGLEEVDLLEGAGLGDKGGGLVLHRLRDFELLCPLVLDGLVRVLAPAVWLLVALVVAEAPAGRLKSKLHEAEGIHVHIDGELRRPELQLPPADDGHAARPRGTQPRGAALLRVDETERLALVARRFVDDALQEGDGERNGPGGRSLAHDELELCADGQARRVALLEKARLEARGGGMAIDLGPLRLVNDPLDYVGWRPGARPVSRHPDVWRGGVHLFPDDPLDLLELDSHQGALARGDRGALTGLLLADHPQLDGSLGLLGEVIDACGDRMLFRVCWGDEELVDGVESIPLVEGGLVGVGRRVVIERVCGHLQARAALHDHEARPEQSIVVPLDVNRAVEGVVGQVVDVLAFLAHRKLADVEVDHAVLVGGARGNLAVEAGGHGDLGVFDGRIVHQAPVALLALGDVHHHDADLPGLHHVDDDVFGLAASKLGGIAEVAFSLGRSGRTRRKHEPSCQDWQ